MGYFMCQTETGGYAKPKAKSISTIDSTRYVQNIEGVIGHVRDVV